MKQVWGVKSGGAGGINLRVISIYRAFRKSPRERRFQATLNGLENSYCGKKVFPSVSPDFLEFQWGCVLHGVVVNFF